MKKAFINLATFYASTKHEFIDAAAYCIARVVMLLGLIITAGIFIHYIHADYFILGGCFAVTAAVTCFHCFTSVSLTVLHFLAQPRLTKGEVVRFFVSTIETIVFGVITALLNNMIVSTAEYFLIMAPLVISGFGALLFYLIVSSIHFEKREA